MFVLMAERPTVEDVRQRFVWYKSPGVMTSERSEAHKFPDMEALKATARAIDARGGWLDFVNVCAQEA